MMDTVWLKLHKDNVEAPEYYMFGPTGIVEFRSQGKGSVLIKSNGATHSDVIETPETIFQLLAKIRRTAKPVRKKKK